ncbi:hypothetical protein ARAF_2638 [Arsenophonus endosymbiont of Aleurodicus floccissimus]|nr:hypothetical protein ARAF_2638 [Arsenophonus endosymbiont of Aleurodicus floccissimus]
MKKHQSPGKIKNAILNWLGVPQNLTDTLSSFHDYSQSKSEQVVTTDKALQLSAVWACVRLLSESISTPHYRSNCITASRMAYAVSHSNTLLILYCVVVLI